MAKLQELKELRSQLESLRASISGIVGFETYRIILPLIDIIEKLIAVLQEKE